MAVAVDGGGGDGKRKRENFPTTRTYVCRKNKHTEKQKHENTHVFFNTEHKQQTRKATSDHTRTHTHYNAIHTQRRSHGWSVLLYSYTLTIRLKNTEGTFTAKARKKVYIQAGRQAGGRTSGQGSPTPSDLSVRNGENKNKNAPDRIYLLPGIQYKRTRIGCTSISREREKKTTAEISRISPKPIFAR